MTKIVGVNEWSEVTLLEDGDKINGGEDGLANAQAKSLVNSTILLKEELLKIKEETAGVDPKKKIAYLGDLEAVEQSLKQSVSDGKGLVAGAITDQGVPTLATDLFKIMADHINSIAPNVPSIPLACFRLESNTPKRGEQLLPLCCSLHFENSTDYVLRLCFFFANN